MQVAPAELEATLMAHPTVAEAAVVPVSDDAAGELPRAYVVLARSHAGAEAPTLAGELQEYVAQKLAAHKHLKGGVKFVDALPKNANAKVMRKVLAERARKEAEEAAERAGGDGVQVFEFDD
jgi:acyl-coenzyme A synthetase/AMP-(fatty) acid ligase